MLTRTQLAILDSNCNVDRQQAVDAVGNCKYNVVFRKHSKKWVAKPIASEKSYDWAMDLMTDVNAVKMGLKPVVLPIIPELLRNIASVPKPDKASVVQNLQSRFVS